MKKNEFIEALNTYARVLDQIKQAAHKVHNDVNQHYDHKFPYSIHLDAVAEMVKKYGAEICFSADDVVPLLFGAYFHDSIEDARLTYNNVHRIALNFMNEHQAHMATEIVYALTNEKGRNRAERANDRYYQGIRSTPYAPLCKCADRLANLTYSVQHTSAADKAMLHVYTMENAHFMSAVIDASAKDTRLIVPVDMQKHLLELTKNN